MSRPPALLRAEAIAAATESRSRLGEAVTIDPLDAGRPFGAEEDG